MYFLRRSEALPDGPPGVRGLRLSLNSPVVSTDDLPVGPARAAILVHDESDGRPNVTICARSLKSGEVLFWSYDGDLGEESSVAVGLDGALSFGESMGFLFDDCEIDGKDDRVGRARGLWAEIVEDAPPEPELVEISPEPAPAEPVLELLDAVDETGEPVVVAEGTDPMVPAPSASPDPAEAVRSEAEALTPEPPRAGMQAASPEPPQVRAPASPPLTTPGPDPASPPLKTQVRDPAAAPLKTQARDPAAAPLKTQARDPAPAQEPTQPQAQGGAGLTAGEKVVPLSKFRFAPPGAAGAAAGAPAPATEAEPGPKAAGEASATPRKIKKRRTALGRVRLVKRWRGGGEARSQVQKLLTLF